MHLGLNIRSQFLLLLIAATLVSQLVSTGYSLRQIRHLDLTTSVVEFEGESALLASRIESSFQTLLQDMQMIPRTPPFQGLIRSTRSNGYDSLDSTTTAMWNARLQQIFASTLLVRPYYTQMRYLGDQDNGMELVRVDQDEEGVRPVIDAALQAKAGEFYYQESLNLGADEIYLSRISLNREHGQLAEKPVPTIRAITPVFYNNGERFGLFIINVNVERLFIDALERNAPLHDTFLFDSYGNFAHYDAASRQADFFMADAATESALDELAQIKEAGSGLNLDPGQVKADDELIYSSRLLLGTTTNSLSLTVAQINPANLALLQAARVEDTAILVAVLALLISLSLAVIAAHYFTRPILKLKDGILAYGEGANELDLPSGRTDEVGELARAFEDVAARLTEAQAREAEAYQRFLSAVDLSIDGLITISEQGQIESINPVACTMFGIGEGFALGTHISAILPGLLPESDRDKPVGDLLNYEEIREGLIETDGLRVTGEVFPIEVSVSEIEGGNARFFWIVLRDITDRRLQQYLLNDALEDLKRSNGELNDFAYIASHDLREPLRGIQIHTQSLIKNLPGQIDSEAARKIGRVNELAERMQQLVTDLLHFSRLNKLDNDGAVSSVDKVLDEVSQTLVTTIDEKSAVIERQVNLPWVRGNSSYISSLFMNLIVNALKYNDADVPRICIGFKEKMEYRGEVKTDVFYVADNGIGIHPDFHEEVFKIFKRLNNEESYGYGTGAGLSFVRKIVERYGGEIWLDSMPGEGTTFYFRLQLVEAKQLPAAAETSFKA